MFKLLLLLVASSHALDDASPSFYEESFIPTSEGDNNSTSQLVRMKDYVTATGARCLDGSPGAFYFRKGVGSGANKFYIHHQGGGWCESLDDCLSRSRTDLGSSKAYPPTQNLGDSQSPAFQLTECCVQAAAISTPTPPRTLSCITGITSTCASEARFIACLAHSRVLLVVMAALSLATT